MMIISDNDNHQFGVDPDEVITMSTMYVEDKQGNPYRQLVVFI